MMKRRSLTVILMIGLSLVAGFVTSCSSAPAGPRLVWSDEFSGTAGAAPDGKNWREMTGGDGWGNQELECYTDTRDNSVVDGHGYLVISARSEPGHACADGRTNAFTSARLSTQGLRAFRYGTLSMRAKLPTGQGIWPAFWALGNDHQVVGWPASGEIDTTEVVGSAPRTSHGTIHGPKADGTPYSLTGTAEAPRDLSAAFHVYSVTWTATSMSFALDAVPYFTVSKATVEKSGRWVFDQPFYLLLNVAVGGTFPGAPSGSTTWPQQMVVDYVRAYEG